MNLLRVAEKRPMARGDHPGLSNADLFGPPARFRSSEIGMKIENCEFPEDVLYDEDGLVWVRQGSSQGPSREIVIGITSIFAALAGRLTKIQAKPLSADYARGKTIGTVESAKYFGPIRTPVDGTLVEVNERILQTPKLLSESPYSDGWYARLRPGNWEEDRKTLHSLPQAKDRLSTQIAALRVHCFVAFPDHELFEIGTECAAVLVKLNELLEGIQVGEVVHVVSDDWTAPTEMANWSQQTKQPVIDSRKEGNLYHFLVRKVS